MNRAERRMGNFGQGGSTEDAVAPGSYNIPMNPFKVEGERPVPFNSGVDKVCSPNLTTSGLTPGPGHYIGQHDTIHTDANGLAPTAFKSKVARIGPTAPGSSVYCESTVHKNPGPGNYDSKAEWELALKKPMRNAMNPWREEREKTVPSIPPQRLPPDAKPENAMGSDMSHVTMKHTGQPSDLPAPGEYDPKTYLTTRSQQHTSFGARSASGSPRKRGDVPGSIDSRSPPKENPGPGAYDSKFGMGEQGEGEKEKTGTYMFTSKTVLSHDSATNPKIAPGPGQYDSPGQIDRSAARARAHSNIHGDRTRFGSAVQRSGMMTRSVEQPYVDPYNVHNVPGPGSYTNNTGGIFPQPSKEKEKEAEKSVPGSKKKKFYGVHHPMIVMALQETNGPLEAFGSTDDRSMNKVMVQTVPPPWAYDEGEARGRSMAAELREKKKLGRHGAFGTLSDRFAFGPMSVRDDAPDVGLMDAPDMTKGGANSDPRSAFTSHTPRAPAAPGADVQAVTLGNTETPAPGAYYIEKEANYRSPFRHPRQDHLSFGSGQGRFDLGSDIMANPAPGDYECSPTRRSGGAAEVKDKRKLARPLGCTSEEVGPGTYGSIDTPMLKKTFNVSTAAPASLSPRRNRGRVGQSMGSSP